MNMENIIIWENTSYETALDKLNIIFDDYVKEQQQKYNLKEAEHKKAAKAKRQELKAINKLPKTKLKRRL